MQTLLPIRDRIVRREVRGLGTALEPVPPACSSRRSKSAQLLPVTYGTGRVAFDEGVKSYLWLQNRPNRALLSLNVCVLHVRILSWTSSSLVLLLPPPAPFERPWLVASSTRARFLRDPSRLVKATFLCAPPLRGARTICPGHLVLSLPKGWAAILLVAVGPSPSATWPAHLLNLRPLGRGGPTPSATVGSQVHWPLRPPSPSPSLRALQPLYSALVRFLIV